MCLLGFTLSGGVKCGADADFVPVEFLSVCSQSCGVPPEVAEAPRSAKEVLFEGNVTYTEGTSLINSRLWQRSSRRICPLRQILLYKLASCVSQDLDGAPLLGSFRVPVPMLL